MPTKTHLTKQEELVPESGIQKRTTDPVAPVLDQIWLNKTSNAIKWFDGSLIQTITGGAPGPVTQVDDERAWGGLVQQLSDAEISAFARNPSPLALIDTMNNESIGTMTNLVKSGSTLTWANGQNTGTYVMDAEVTDLVDKVTGVVVATIRAFAPKPTAITPTPSDTAPVVKFYGDLTQYFPLTKPVMIFKNTVVNSKRVHKHLIYQNKIALLNVTACSYNSGTDETSLTLSNPNGLDIGLSINVVDYTSKLRIAPWDTTIEARGSLLGAYDVCDLKSGYCEGSIRMFSEQAMQAFGPGAVLNSNWEYEIDFSPNKQYGILILTELFNIGGNDRNRLHFYWSANGGQTWTKFAFTYETPNIFGNYSQPDLWGNNAYVWERLLVSDNGRAVILFVLGHPSNGQGNINGYYANLTDVTPAMVGLPYDGGGGAGSLWYNSSYSSRSWSIDGPRDTMSAFAISFYWQVLGCDYRLRTMYFTWANTPGALPVFQWLYGDEGDRQGANTYWMKCWRKSDGFHVVMHSPYICSTTNRLYSYFLADQTGNTLYQADGGTQDSDYRVFWIKETTNYIVWSYYRVNGNPFNVNYLHKDTPGTVVRSNASPGLVGTWMSGANVSYGSQSSGIWAEESGHMQEYRKRVWVDPTNEKRIIFPYSIFDGQYRRLFLMEIDDFTNQKPITIYNQSDNAWWYLGADSQRTQVAQTFQYNSSFPLRAVALKFFKDATGYTWDRGDNTISVEIQETTGGYPNGTVVAAADKTLDASLITYESNVNWKWFNFNPGLSLVNGNTYAIVVKQTVAPLTTFYGVAGSNFYVGLRSYNLNSYGNGKACQYNGSVWSDLGGSASNDFCFLISHNFVRELDDEWGYEASKMGFSSNYDGHALMCQTGPYEIEWAYRMVRGNNLTSFTMGGQVWKRKITMDVSAANAFTMTDRKPLGYRGEGIDYDQNLCFNWSIADPASLRKYRTGTVDLGRYTEENSHLGLGWNTWGGAEPGGLRVADSDFQDGYAFDCGNNANCLRWNGDGDNQHQTWNFDYKGHLWAFEAEIKPTNSLGTNDMYIAATHGVGSGWIVRLVNGYLAFYNSSFGNCAIANDMIEPNVYHKIRVVKNYVTKKYHLFRSLVAPYTVFTEVGSYSVQAINVGDSGSDSYFSVGGDTALNVSNRFWGRIGYVKLMHGPVRPYMNYNPTTGFYEPFAYSGYKNHSPLNRMRPLYGDANGNAKWAALRFKHRKDDNAWAPELVMINAENLSIVDSYDQILTYQKSTLTAQGQEPGVKVTMNRSGSQNANAIRGIAFEFNGP